MQGFVYILVSPNSSHIKIGGTERPIGERMQGINRVESYAEHGPWELSDFLHVTDWRVVESGMHRHFQDRNVRDISGTRELFAVPPHEARARLRLTDVALRVGHEKTATIFKNESVGLYLYKLFQLSGLYGCLDIQGAWTLSLLPKTNGGRWFTLNIGPHEVAFSTFKPIDGKVEHYLVLDRLILDYPETVIWIGKRDGEVQDATYISADRAVLVSFRQDFANAELVFNRPGVRRALIAYWAESLADLRERKAKSVYARFHSYDAISELIEYKRARESVFRGA
ncbi:GIY-YIG nuclease family protein [Bradyrhizobium sp.]|uniref:GIY-YIG nuclease family protein n=1 Tax=Bradyrhizobium sp. TaxID=376 RepID=UPI002CA486DC|nr:GIY-YIG nuclease family protein [Bradyrhizobium sp.]HMM88804.1 GIY-YIG nuclease family protein [Bradyrhizobium sp.]